MKNTKKPLFGVCYFPEHWPEEKWEDDCLLMKKVGIDVVRVAEFTWSKIEPQRNKFNNWNPINIYFCHNSVGVF